MDSDRTNRNACSTGDANITFEHHLCLTLQAFWVSAPFASQRTTLKEYQCPDTRAVMHIIFLNIEYDRFTFDQISILVAHVTPSLQYF
jgi:hypothetical protein